MTVRKHDAVWTLEEDGANRPAADQAEREFRITVAADWAPIREYERLIVDRPTAVLGDLLPLFRGSDLNIVNVEAVLGEHGQPIRKDGPHLRGDERAVRELVKTPFHVACLANNHTLDYGPEGLAHTLRVLRQAGLHTVGGGMNGEEAAKPLFLQAGTARLAIVNVAEGEGSRSVGGGPGAHGFDACVSADRVREARREADIVLAIFHGGREFVPLPPPYVVEGMRRLAEAGAAAVIAHHPHVPQGLEFHGGVPIVYSLGNFVFWMPENLYYRHVGFAVHLTLAGSRISRLELSPYRTGSGGLSLLQGAERASFLERLEEVSRPLADPSAVADVWHAFADRIGFDGLVNQLQNHLAIIAKDAPAGAAKLLNKFLAPAHSELFLTGLRREAEGRSGDSPEWARRLVERWMTVPAFPEAGGGNRPGEAEGGKRG